MAVFVVKAKTVIVYYSFTNNVHTIVNDLSRQIEDDVKIEVTPRRINLAGEHGPAAIYRADGRKVSTITREEASATLQSGCYIVRFRRKSGLSAAKVLIP